MRMEAVYRLLDAEVNDVTFSSLLVLADDSFDEIKSHQDNHELRDMSILFYLYNTEGVEMASFQVLQLMVVKL